jgi:hypothetical protein
VSLIVVCCLLFCCCLLFVVCCLLFVVCCFRRNIVVFCFECERERLLLFCYWHSIGLTKTLLVCRRSIVLTKNVVVCLFVVFCRFGCICDVDDIDDNRKSLFSLHKSLVPTVFDHWIIVEGKMFALINSHTHKNPSPQSLLQYLSVLSEFRLYDCNHQLPRIVFAVLKCVLLLREEQFDAVHRFVLDVVVYSPQFLPNLLELLSDYNNPATVKLLEQLNLLLCRLDPVQLVLYVPLLLRICSFPSLDPTILLSRLFLCVSVLLRDRMRDSDSQSRNLESISTEWSFGDDVVAVLIAAMIHQTPNRLSVWSPVGKLLEMLWKFFPDVEIRDRAHFLWLLCSRVPPERVAKILSGPEEVICCCFVVCCIVLSFLCTFSGVEHYY